MQSVKTAISLQKPLFEQAENIARRMKVSRSRLFVLALEDYIQRQQNCELLNQIKAAYAAEPEPAEKVLRRKARPAHRRIIEDEW
jgi:metal-responsive CopG/Arc/MetJ family transcriptional regulator